MKNRVTGDFATLEDTYDVRVEVPQEPSLEVKKVVRRHDEVVKSMEELQQQVSVFLWWLVLSLQHGCGATFYLFFLPAVILYIFLLLLSFSSTK